MIHAICFSLYLILFEEKWLVIVSVVFCGLLECELENFYEEWKSRVFMHEKKLYVFLKWADWAEEHRWILIYGKHTWVLTKNKSNWLHFFLLRLKIDTFTLNFYSLLEYLIAFLWVPSIYVFILLIITVRLPLNKNVKITVLDFDIFCVLLNIVCK